MIPTRRLMLCAAAAVALLAPGCGNEPRASSTGFGGVTRETDAAAPPHAKVEFVTPKDGATVASTFKAKVDLTNFQIDSSALGRAPTAGRGHLHFQLDDGRFDTRRNAGPNGQAAHKLGVEGKYSPATQPEITYEDVPPGEHILAVHLANNDHTDTGAMAEVEITVR
jgi:hypothetical protein